MIKEIDLNKRLVELHSLVNRSFLTVALEYGLTAENAPTNPAFISADSILKTQIEKNISYFGYFEKEKIIGCYALEPANNEKFYLERLCVHPSKRHNSIGHILMKDAFKRVKAKDANIISIGIINDNIILKEWYKGLGFKEIEIKTFERLPFDVCFMEKNI